MPRLTSLFCMMSLTLLSLFSSSEKNVNWTSFLFHSTRETLPLKSKRVDISLFAWFTAFSTSCRSSLDTTSKEKSSAIHHLLSKISEKFRRPFIPHPEVEADRVQDPERGFSIAIGVYRIRHAAVGPLI